MPRSAFALIGIAILTSACGASGRTEAPAPIAVTVARVQSASLPSSFEAGGAVRARATAVIASRVMAPVLAVHVRAGDRVRRGEPLVELDGREATASRARARASLVSADEDARALDAEVRAADASLALARATHDRVSQLRDRKSATPQEFDQAHAALESAEAQVTAVRARVASAAAARDAAAAGLDVADVTASYASLTAPFDGVVTERSIDPGAIAHPAAPLLTLEDTSAFTLDATVDEARARHVTPQQPADVDLGEIGRVQGRVVEIARVDPESHSFLVKIDIGASPALRSGLFGRARFTTAPRQTLVIPGAAVVRRGQLAFVFAIDADGRARLQPISPGAAADERLEVLAGLREGESVVINPPPTLSDGMRVTGDRR